MSTYPSTQKKIDGDAGDEKMDKLDLSFANSEGL
jgi:hypothetical protein